MKYKYLTSGERRQEGDEIQVEMGLSDSGSWRPWRPSCDNPYQTEASWRCRRLITPQPTNDIEYYTLRNGDKRQLGDQIYVPSIELSSRWESYNPDAHDTVQCPDSCKACRPLVPTNSTDPYKPIDRLCYFDRDPFRTAMELPINTLVTVYLRYQAIKKMTPEQFNDIWNDCQDGIAIFDMAVDRATRWKTDK